MPCGRTSLLIGESGARSFAGTFEEIKRQIYPGSFVDPEVIKIQVWRPSGTLVRVESSPQLILDYGAQRDLL